MDKARPSRKGNWIPWLFVGMFVLVLVVNGTMITIAALTFNGLETTDAYEKGLAYNERLAAAAEQDRLGWQVDVEAVPDGDGGTVVTVTLNDNAGRPLNGAAIGATLSRPIEAGREVSLVLDGRGQGRYQKAVELPLPGQWALRLEILAKGTRYFHTARIHAAATATR